MGAQIDIKIMIFISLLLLIFLIFITGYKFAKKQKLNVIALSIILIIFYFLGFDSFKQNHLNINEWIIQSANNTRNTKVGELYFKSKETLKSYNEIENEKKEKIKSKISFYQSNLNNSLIVRFLNNVFLIKNNNLDDMKVYLGDSKIFPFYALDDDIFLAHKGGDLIKASFSKDIIWMSPTKNLYIHHWGDVYDEKIYVPGKIFVNLPNNISSSYTQSNYSKCKLKNATHNTIEIFDLNNHNKYLSFLSKALVVFSCIHYLKKPSLHHMIQQRHSALFFSLPMFPFPNFFLVQIKTIRAYCF